MTFEDWISEPESEVIEFSDSDGSNNVMQVIESLCWRLLSYFGNFVSNIRHWQQTSQLTPLFVTEVGDENNIA